MHADTVVTSKSLEWLVREKVSHAFKDADIREFRNVHELVMNPAEKALILYVLERCNGNQVWAAKILGINRNTLRKRIKLHKLVQPPQPSAEGSPPHGLSLT
jgi:DNA-binding protein Fis